MTRAEHIAWCKARALEYLDIGDVRNAITSMLSDLSKHDETAHAGRAMTLVGFHVATQNDVTDARRFIEGFN